MSELTERELDGLETPPRLITKFVMAMPVDPLHKCITIQPHNHGPYPVSKCRLADRLRTSGSKLGQRYSMLHRGAGENDGALMIWRIE